MRRKASILALASGLAAVARRPPPPSGAPQPARHPRGSATRRPDLGGGQGRVAPDLPRRGQRPDLRRRVQEVGRPDRLRSQANLKASHAAVTIDIGSVVTGDPTRDQMLPTPDWFAFAEVPASRLRHHRHHRRSGLNRYLATGDLRVRGAVRHVAMPFTLTIVKDVANMNGALTIDRRQFGIGQGQFATPDTVAANVTIMVKLSAKKAR